MVHSSVKLHNDWIMAHNSSFIVHNLKCQNKNACMNNGWMSNRVFGNQIGNQVFSIGSIQ